MLCYSVNEYDINYHLTTGKGPQCSYVSNELGDYLDKANITKLDNVLIFRPNKCTLLNLQFKISNVVYNNIITFLKVYKFLSATASENMTPYAN